MEERKIRTDIAIRRKELRRWIIMELDRNPPTLKQVMAKFGISLGTAHKDMVAYNKDLKEIDTSALDAAVIAKLLEAVRLTRPEGLSMKELSGLKAKGLDLKANIEGNVQVAWKTLDVPPAPVVSDEDKDQSEDNEE